MKFSQAKKGFKTLRISLHPCLREVSVR